MAASVNKVTLIGNLGRDPELRHMTNGTAVCAVSIATSRNWKDKTSGERQEETEWHRAGGGGKAGSVWAEWTGEWNYTSAHDEHGGTHF